jgi:hypothetical protein
VAALPRHPSLVPVVAVTDVPVDSEAFADLDAAWERSTPVSRLEGLR